MVRNTDLGGQGSPLQTMAHKPSSYRGAAGARLGPPGRARGGGWRRPSGAVCGRLGPSGAGWGRLAPPGRAWRRRGARAPEERRGGRLGPCVAVWGRLGPAGGAGARPALAARRVAALAALAALAAQGSPTETMAHKRASARAPEERRGGRLGPFVAVWPSAAGWRRLALAVWGSWGRPAPPVGPPGRARGRGEAGRPSGAVCGRLGQLGPAGAAGAHVGPPGRARGRREAGRPSGAACGRLRPAGSGALCGRLRPAGADARGTCSRCRKLYFCKEKGGTTKGPDPVAIVL